MPHVTLYTPSDSSLSSGLVCFDVKGLAPETVVEEDARQRHHNEQHTLSAKLCALCTVTA